MTETNFTPAQLEALLEPYPPEPPLRHPSHKTFADCLDSRSAWRKECAAILKRREDAAPDLARLVLEKEKEIAELKAKLSQTPTAEWFYNPDDWEYSYESPRHVIDCMDLPDGNHVIRVDAAAVKPIYCAVKIATNDPDAPWPYTLTEHETEDEARQAMKETSDE